MRISPDEALDNLRRYTREEWRKLTEADTRCKIIDPLLTQCLNWHESDISREEHTETGYVDYVLRLRGKNVLVIEAKRIGRTFTLPITFNFRRQYNVGSAISTEPSIKKALQQAQDYCISHGARFAIVTNGDEYIIFEAIREGEEWAKGHCVIFYNFDDIITHFTEFWNILSKDAVEKNSLVDIVSGKAEEYRFTRVVDGVHFKNEKNPRNDLSRYMAPIISYAFQEITEPEKLDMLRTCYVYEKQFASIDSGLRSYFSKEMPGVYRQYDIRKVIEGAGDAGVFQMELAKFREIFDVNRQEPIMFLILGSIGSGKTTFIHRFFNVVLSEGERKSILWFYVNMRDAPIDEQLIAEHIFNSIIQDLSNRYNPVLKKLRDDFKIAGISPRRDEIIRLFAILKALGYGTYLVIDNVDQHISQSAKYHERVFLEANNLTKSLRSMTILTLREESFYLSKTSGAFNAYYINKYLIEPPDFIELMLHRLDYILAKLNLPGEEFKNLINANLDYGYRLPAIRDFLQIVRDSIERKGRGGISAFMRNISGENMRRALDLFSDFLISGNTKIDEMLDKFTKYGKYQISYHQFIRSIMLGEYRYYSEMSSYLMNIFDFNIEYSNSHFLSLKILAYAKDHLTNESETGRGYVSINAVRNLAEDVLINPKAVEECLVRLARYGLVLLDTRSRETLDHASAFKITECGDYYLGVLLFRFAYVDLIISDTPIADPDLVSYLRRIISSKDMNDRFDRTRRFLDYLHHMEWQEMKFNPEYSASPLAKYSFTWRMIHEFEKERKYITTPMSSSS